MTPSRQYPHQPTTLLNVATKNSAIYLNVFCIAVREQGKPEEAGVRGSSNELARHLPRKTDGRATKRSSCPPREAEDRVGGSPVASLPSRKLRHPL